MEAQKDMQGLRNEIKNLKRELRGENKGLPNHSIRPHQILAIDELEERIAIKVIENF